MPDLAAVIDDRMRERIARRAAEMFADDPGSSRWAYAFDDEIGEDDDLLDGDGNPADALVDFARGRIGAAVSALRSQFGKGSATVWRAVSGDETLLDDIAASGEIGIYWTWVREAAFAHWGGGEIDLIFEAEIRPDDVDWPATVLAAVLDAGADEGFHEAEIRLRPDAPVRVSGIRSRPNGDLFYDSWSDDDCVPVDPGPLEGLDLRAGRPTARRDRLFLDDVSEEAPSLPSP